MLPDPVDKIIYETRIVKKDGSLNFYSVEEGVKKMRKGLFAFHMEVTVGYRYVSKFYEEGEKCDIREVIFAKLGNPYLIHRKHSPSRESLRQGWVPSDAGYAFIYSFSILFLFSVLRIREQGIMRRLSRQIYTSKPKCSGGGGFLALGWVDIKPAISILSFGCVVSLLVLVAELVFAKLYH